MVTALDEVKTLLNISDTEQDGVINIIIRNVEMRLNGLLEAETVPEALAYIITEVSVARFNRLGSEGMKSDSVEGYSVAYATVDDFTPYMGDIAAYTDSSKGKAGWMVML